MADFSDEKTSNNKGFIYIFIIIDNFSNFLWAIPLKTKNSQTVADAISKFLSISKRSPVKLGSDRGTEFFNSFFQHFLKSKNVHHYSWFTKKLLVWPKRVSELYVTCQRNKSL